MNEVQLKKVNIFESSSNSPYSCLSNFFSCCLQKLNSNKSNYINRWRKYIKKYLTSNHSLNDPFAILTNLWAHQNVIADLNKVRINPKIENNYYENNNYDDLISIRDDLEFYIPQLCLFIVFGEFELVEELLSFLCKACYSSFFFAHKVLWFLKSMLKKGQESKSTNEKINRIIHVIQTIYKSDSENRKLIVEHFYVSGSDNYYKYITNSNKQSTEFTLNVFKKYSSYTNSEEYLSAKDIGKIKLIDENDMNLTSFFSSINFFDTLCEISERLKTIENHNKREEEFLSELTMLNKGFPQNIYIPFSNRNTRNYVIMNISLNDCKIFKTKERAPFLLTCECIRLEEMCYIVDKNNYIEKAKSFELDSLSFPNNFNSFLRGEGRKSSEEQKIKYLISEDKKLSSPIYVGKHKKVNYNSNKIINDFINKGQHALKEKEYQKIDQVLKENINRDNCLLEEEISPAENKKDELIKEETKEEKPKRKLSASSNSSSDEHSEDVDNNNQSVYGQENKEGFDLLEKIPNFNSNNNNLFNIFGQTFSQLKSRLKRTSPYGNLFSYKPIQFIFKSGEDLRQEQFASQLINTFAQIFKVEKVNCFLYPYEIISTGNNCGIIEVVENSISIDYLKQKINSISPGCSLKDFYEKFFIKGTHKYNKAIKNLIESLAGYSLVCYFLQIKDRHNANILIDNTGHLIHIDFGFIFSHSPGHEFETAPFKLTEEIIEIFGGTNSSNFQKFRKLLWKGMIAISKHYQKILILVEMMYCGYGKNMECFKDGEKTISDLKRRFKPKENMSKKEYIELVDTLIQKALGSWRTKWYDKYQYYFQGIFY